MSKKQCPKAMRVQVFTSSCLIFDNDFDDSSNYFFATKGYRKIHSGTTKNITSLKV